MPSQPSTETPSGLRDHGLLFKRERMESVSRPMLLDNNFRASVRDNASLFEYGSPGLKLTEHSVAYPRSPAHSLGLQIHRDDARETERDIVQRSSLKSQSEDDSNNSACSLVPVNEVSGTTVNPSLPTDTSAARQDRSSPNSDRQLARICDTLHAHQTENSRRDKSSEVDQVDSDAPSGCNASQSCGSPTTAAAPCSVVLPDKKAIEADSCSSLHRDSRADENELVDDVPRPALSDRPLEPAVDPNNLPLEQQSLTRLLSTLTSQETLLFDDVMESLVNVITHDLLTDEMSDGHRPSEPTPGEIDAMVNTWEDLFQNPFEYMLHSLESCPNCGRMIALSRMAPHIVTSCGENRSADTKKKRRKGLAPPVRETRSSLAAARKPLPQTASQSDLSQQTEVSSSQASCSSSGFAENSNSMTALDGKPDPKRMFGLENEISRLKRRASMEAGQGSSKRSPASEGPSPELTVTPAPSADPTG